MRSTTSRKVWDLCLCVLCVAILLGCSGKESRIRNLIAQFSREATVTDPTKGEQARDALVIIGGDAVPQLCRNLDDFSGLLISKRDVNDVMFSIQTLKQIGIDHPETVEKSIPTLLRLFSKFEPTANPKELAATDPLKIMQIKGSIRWFLINTACFSYGISSIAPILDFIQEEGDDSPVMQQAGFAVDMIMTMLQPASIDSLKNRIPSADDTYRKSLVKRVIRIIGSGEGAKATLRGILDEEKAPEIRAIIEKKLAELQ